jgi:hypothetical protein
MLVQVSERILAQGFASMTMRYLQMSNRADDMWVKTRSDLL